MSIQHGMGWEPQGGYGWVHGTAWHPSTANIKSSVNVCNLLFLITQPRKDLLGQEKTDRQAPFYGKNQNTRGDIVSPNRLKPTGQLLTFLQAGKNVCLDVQTVLDSSLTSLSAIRALTGK